MHIRFNNSSRSGNKIKQLPFFVCRTFDKHFSFISVSTSYLDPKIQYHENRTFLFCLSIERSKGSGQVVVSHWWRELSSN